MARIRTVKPSFFRHEGLQELELQHPGKYPMFVFAGLWGHCDKMGRFLWKPRTLKLDILPFLPFDMAGTLCILENHGYVKQYEVEGKVYGLIPTFTEHQRINGKEAQSECEFPAPPITPPPSGITREVPEDNQGSDGEAPETPGREGKGREQEEEGNGLAPGGVTIEEVVARWNALPGVVRAQSITGPIRKCVHARIRDHPTIDWWEALFQRVAASDFLTGRKTDFAATLDWVLGPKNMAKLMNGNYDNRQEVGRGGKAQPKSLVDLL